MSFPRYPNYKDSGVKWLGEVPEEWGTNRLKEVASVSPSNVDKKEYEGEVAVQLCNYTDVYYNDQIDASSEFMRATASSFQVEKFTLRSGDVLLTKDSETSDDIARSAYVPADLPGVVCGYHLSIARPRDTILGSYSKKTFDTDFVRAQAEVSSNGLTRVGLSQSAMDNLLIPMPPLSQQGVIVNFLDRETAKIDGLIEEQRRMIELLKEKLQAVISHAVTKGLNSASSVLDSGITWLGTIPKHWQVRRLSSISTKITNGFVGPTRDIYVNAGVRYLQSLHIKNGRIIADNAYFVSDTWSNEKQKSILRTGDVLIVQTGDIGQAAVVTEEFAGSNCHALIIVSPETTVVSGEWLARVAASDYGLHTLLSIQTGALHPHLNCGDVKDVVAPVPPLDEQRSILSFIEREEKAFESLIHFAESSIVLLQERRSTLISAAVTGRIDVRQQLKNLSLP